MMSNTLLIFLAVAATVCFFVAVFYALRIKSQSALQRLEKNLCQKQLTVANTSLVSLQQENAQLQLRLQALNIRIDEREKSHTQQLALFNEQKQAMANEFELLANKVFEDRQRSFQLQSKTSLEQLLAPFKTQIEGFQKRINDVHTQSIKGHTALEGEIKKVLEVGLKMQDEATNLTSALKGDAQKRGAWGEAQLQRTLEMSGLIEGAHFSKQQSFKNAEGKHRQTDFLIQLPDNKHIIIDSKVTLNAYANFVDATIAEQQEQTLDAHAAAVKAHVDDLSAKDYTHLIGMHSPSFVLLFMPIEPAYIEALKYKKKDLFAYAYEKNIILVSHTTLMPILRTVANLWMLESSNQEARELADKAGEIYNQVCTVAERLQKLGGSLAAVSNHYNNTVTALVGQQGLHSKVQRFNQLSAKANKTMPKVDALQVEHSDNRLDLMAEVLEKD